MAFYKTPIRPFDPVVPDDQPAQPIRYIRDEFAGTGQDSFTNPPAQDQSLWQQLLNVQPIQQGNIRRRYGYNALTNFGFNVGVIPTHLYKYQRDADGLRKLLVSTTQPVPGTGTTIVPPYDMLSMMVMDPSLRTTSHYEGIKPVTQQTVTSVTVSNNVCTVSGPHKVSVGQFMTYSGLTKATFLNGALNLTVTAVTPTSISFNFTHANYAQTPDTGTGYALSDHAYFQIDATRFWWVKGDGNNPPGAGGFPWDIQLYDSNNIYFSVTELNFTSPNDCKRFESLNPAIGLHGVPFAKRFMSPGDFVTSPESARVVVYQNGVATSNFLLGHVRCELHGPFVNQNFGGNLPPNLTTIQLYYRWGGTDPSPVYNTQEVYTFAWDPVTQIRYGLVAWQTSPWNPGTNSYAPPTDSTLHNQIVAGVSGLPAYDPSGFGGGAASGNPPAFQNTFSGGSNMLALNEDGTVYANNVSSTTISLPNAAPRSLASRDYAYTYLGTSGSNKKWDGSVDAQSNATNVTNWGIDVNSVSNSSFGPNVNTVAVDTKDQTVQWTNPGNAVSPADGVVATQTFNAPAHGSTLQMTNFNLNVSGNVTGIQVDVSAAISANGSGVSYVRPVTFTGVSNQNQAPFVNPANAADGVTTTSSTGSGHYITVTVDPGPPPVRESQPVLAQEIWSGFPTYTGPTATAFNLKAAWSSSFTTPGRVELAVSSDSGVTWTPFASATANTGLQTTVIGLPLTQDLTKMQVRAQATVNGSGTSGLATLTLQDVWIEVTGPQTNVPPNTVLNVAMFKNGSLYGEVKSIPITSGTLAFLTLGGSSDLWKGTWTAADLNTTNCGIVISLQNAFTGVTVVSIDYARIKVFTSGAGITLISKNTAGSVILTVGRVYYVAFKNSKTGHLSDLSFASASTGPLTGNQVVLGLPSNNDPQVDSKVLLATPDGGDPSLLYLLAELPNSATSYGDNTPDTTLVLNQLYLFTDDSGNEFGVTQNDPPPLGTLAIKHKGRLWMAVGQNLFFSKSVVELTLPNGFIAGKYEEAWPADNYFDVSPGAETISALLSDGNVLYIGTERHVRLLFGDNPDNFQQPQMVHQEVGVLNQDVWQTVYVEGSPVGALWLTPDFRCIASDFNQYTDIGHPIQDVLNSINPAAAKNAHAMFVSQGPYDLYILAIPTGTNTYCDTHLVFDLRARRWFVWVPTNQSTAMLFNIGATGNPMWLFTDTNNLYQYLDVPTDNGASFLCRPQTSWMHFGMPTQRKLLNEVEIIGDPTMTVTVEGAATQADFLAPHVCAFQQAITLDPLGHYKLFLAGAATRYRYYRMTFQSTSTSTDFLDSYNVQVIPVHSL